MHLQEKLVTDLGTLQSLKGIELQVNFWGAKTAWSLRAGLDEEDREFWRDYVALLEDFLEGRIEASRIKVMKVLKGVQIASSEKKAPGVLPGKRSHKRVGSKKA